MVERFVFPLRGVPNEMLDRVKRETRKQGISFNGNVERGSFSKSVFLFGIVLKGSYTVRDNEVDFTFNIIPPGYDRGRIEREARKLFG